MHRSARKHPKCLCLFALLCLLPLSSARATVFSQLNGIVHDPQHRPLPGAHIAVRAGYSDLAFSAVSDRNGAFTIPAIPLGDYIITVTDPASIPSGRPSPSLPTPRPSSTFSSGSRQSASPSQFSARKTPPTSTASLPPHSIDRIDIARHTRGRPHQLHGHDHRLRPRRLHDPRHAAHAWRPRTQLADRRRRNSQHQHRPQHRPPDRSQGHRLPSRSSAAATPPTWATARTASSTSSPAPASSAIARRARPHRRQLLPDQRPALARRPHRKIRLVHQPQRQPQQLRTSACRLPAPVHDAENGYGGFASLIYNQDPANQIRYITQLRTDYYQIPYDPDLNDWENQLYDSSGLRDGEHETDGYGAFTWLHTFNPTTSLRSRPSTTTTAPTTSPVPTINPRPPPPIETGYLLRPASKHRHCRSRRTPSQAGIYG